MRQKIFLISYLKLLGGAAIVALVCCVLAYSLKHLTEHIEHFMLNHVAQINPVLYIILPSVGITSIYFLRKYIFHNRKNKGIREIYTTLETRKDHLPFFKIPSHYINGFLTVIFGGSTGIEVSTVVATATVGNQVYKRGFMPLAFKRELICAGVVAGVTVLFGSVIGGWLFAIEVIGKRFDRTVLLSCTMAALVSFGFVYYFDHGFLITISAQEWHWKAVPFMLVLGLLGGLLATYFTQIVIRCKHWFAQIKSNFIRVNLGAIAVGLMIFFFPSLYGDSYSGLSQMLTSFTQPDVLVGLPLVLGTLIVLKPLVASLTLGAGGDGGVFAPSIVAGAFLGILFAYLCNKYGGMELRIINFALIGAAATLSAAIHGPWTAIFLMCSIAPNGYQLLLPLGLGAFVAYLLSRKLCPYNVYSYQEA